MRAENNKIIQPIPKPIAEDVHLPSYFLKGLAANVIDPINIVFSFLNLESILNFYRSIPLNKAASNFQTSAINSLFTTRAITKKDIAVQKKLLKTRFANKLDDALVHNIVTSPAHSLHFKLKAQLENIVRLHTAIPMDLQKILCDFCMSEQFSSDYVFLIGYLEKSSQTIIIKEFIEQSNHADWHAKSAAITALSDIFTYLDSTQKTSVLSKLIEKLNGDDCCDAITRLGAIFSYLDSTQKTSVLSKLIEKLNGDDCCDAITRLGAIFADLDVEQKTLVLDKLIEKLNDVNWSFQGAAITALGAIFSYLDSAKKNIILSKLIEKLNHSILHVQNAAITALSVAFADLDVEQKTSVLDKLVEKLNDVNSSFKDVAIKTLGAIFSYLDSAKKNIVSNELIKKLNCYDCYDAITRLGAIFSYLDTKKRELVLDNLIKKLNDVNFAIKTVVTKALGVAFAYLDLKQKERVLDVLIKKSNGVDYQATITKLGVVFAYLDCLVQKKAVLDELIKQLNNVDWRIAAVAATALGTAFAYLDAEQKKVVLDALIAKLNHSEQMVEQAAKEALENIALNNILSPMQKQLLLSHPKLTDAAKIKITQAVLNFISPCISINISATNRPKLTDALLAVNNIFYQNFLNPTETNLIVLKDKMTDLIRVTQESQSSVGLFSGVPADQQLMEYFKLPESLKARILLKEAFGFPDESVIEFEKSLRALMCVHTSLTPRFFKWIAQDVFLNSTKANLMVSGIYNKFLQ